MYDYVFNEEEMKKKEEEKQEKEDEKRKSASIFIDHQARTGRGF